MFRLLEIFSPHVAEQLLIVLVLLYSPFVGSDGPPKQPCHTVAVLWLQTVQRRRLSGATRVGFPETGVHVDVARACLHQHDAETQDFFTN